MCYCAVGYRSRADEKSWNGASRKVLDHQIATHVVILKSIPLIFSTVEKKGVCDIDFFQLCRLISNNSFFFSPLLTRIAFFF